MESSTNASYSESPVGPWLRRNRGILAEIAKRLDFSHEFVRLVVRGRKRNPAIERILRGRGWRRYWVQHHTASMRRPRSKRNV
jgi:hypothetical protein